MKREIDTLDATPSKRLFHSIIADYDLNRSICELIDNALDAWVKGGRAQSVTIALKLDMVQQTICVEDNAGGVPKDELTFIVSPGQTSTSPTDETIGIFGVGSKRAVVALAQDVRIRTRSGNAKTYQVEFDDNWLEDGDWEMPVYEVDSINPRTTKVDLHRLRMQLNDDVIGKLIDHLQATYARFLKDGRVTLTMNGKLLLPCFFENWAYPPDYVPQRYTGTIPTAEGRNIRFEAVAGLIRESSPAAGEYGVYFYCNDRLIARGLKSLEVGFTRGLAGLPHPKVSLTRVLVYLYGDARSMPWNSSKSDISTKHEVFRALHGWLVQVVKDYASLSRVLMGDWPDKVFQYDTGTIKEVPIDSLPTATRSYLPPLPRSRPRYGEVVVQKNRAVTKAKPWTKGLLDGVIAADLIGKQRRLDERNRLVLILLDSTLEIAFKEYLVHDSGATYGDAQLLNLFKNRSAVQTEVQKYVAISSTTWNKIDHYYRLRCKLIHERATVGISDSQIDDFREVVEGVLQKLYKLRFEKR